MHTTHDIYMPVEFTENLSENNIEIVKQIKKHKGTIYHLPKEFYIDEKTGMRKFKKPILSKLVPINEGFRNMIIDKDKDFVVLV